MMKITYECKAYYFENINAKQGYDLNAEMVLNDEACLDDLLEAILKMAKIAGYAVYKDKVIELIKNLDFRFDGE